MLQEHKIRHLIAASRAMKPSGTQYQNNSKFCSRFYLISYLLSLLSLKMPKEPGLVTNLYLGKPIPSSIREKAYFTFIQNFFSAKKSQFLVSCNSLYQTEHNLLKQKQSSASRHKGLGVVQKKLKKLPYT